MKNEDDLQAAVNDVLINRLLDVELGTIQYTGGSEGNLVEYRTIASLPNVSHRNEDYMMEGGTRPLTISNVIEVKGKEGLPGIINGNRGPEELENGVLPNRCLGWVSKEEVIYGIIYCGAHCTHWKQVGRRKYAAQQGLMRKCCSDPSFYPLKLPLTSRDLFKLVQKTPRFWPGNKQLWIIQLD